METVGSVDVGTGPEDVEIPEGLESVIVPVASETGPAAGEALGGAANGGPAPGF